MQWLTVLLLMVGICGVLAGTVAWLVWGQKQRDRQVNALRAVVEERGGSYRSVGTPVGTLSLGGREGRVTFTTERGDPPKRFTDVVVELPLGFSWMSLTPHSVFTGLSMALGGQDVQIGEPDVDDAFQIKGTSKDVYKLLTPTVQSVLMQLHDSASSVEVVATDKEAQLRVRRSGWIDDPEQLAHHLDFCDALAEGLCARHAASWHAAAEMTGLTFSSEGLPMLSGTVDDTPVEARLRWDRGQWLTTIRATIRAPKGLRIVHIDQGEGHAISVENPILGMMAHITADDPDAARALLADTALTEELLAVVHGIPGSTVTEDAVTITLPGRLWEELPETVAQAVRLGVMLNARVQTTPPHQAARRPQRQRT